MERWGSRIRFMINEMRKLGRPDPRFEERGEVIVTFSHEATSASEEIDASQSDVSPPTPTRKKTSRTSGKRTLPEGETDSLRKKRQKLALRYVHTHGSITDKRYRALTGAPEHIALRDLEVLQEQGSLRVIDQKQGRRYVL